MPLKLSKMFARNENKYSTPNLTSDSSISEKKDKINDQIVKISKRRLKCSVNPYPILTYFCLVLCLLLTICEKGATFNVAPQAFHVASSPERTSKEKSAYFGYSVGLLKKNNATWLLAGAPRSSSLSSPDVKQPGTLFKCQLHKPHSACKEVILDRTSNFARGQWVIPFRDDAWTGASLDIDEEGNVIVCAPRWKNAYYTGEYRISGMCYLLGADLESYSSFPLKPLTDPGNQIFNYYGKGVFFYAHGQFGFDIHFTKRQELLISSPGVLNWQGSVVKYVRQMNIPSGGTSKREVSIFYQKLLVPNTIHTPTVKDSDLFGYSVTSGKFDAEGRHFYVAGAPRGVTSHGMVLIFLMRDHDSERLYIKEMRHGTQMGEYFGASVAAPDFNRNGFSDLVVGAPLHSLDGAYDVGCVYVFMSNEKEFGNLATEGIKLTGDVVEGARFGTALGTPGDLDRDSYDDLLIGAPYENNEGAVYVFMGSRNGIREQYSQKLKPEQVSQTTSLRGFGISFSRPVDVDENLYPDFAVGSFLSDEAIVMLTRPVLIVKGRILADTQKLVLTKSNFTAIPCLSYEGIGVPLTTEIAAQISLSHESLNGETVASFRDFGSTERKLIFRLTKNKEECKHLAVDLKLKRSNAQKPVIIMMDFELKNKDLKGPDDPIMSPHSSSPPDLVLSFITGCQGDFCKSNLRTSAGFKGFEADGRLLVGEILKITLEVKVTNKEEPAFLPNVTIIIPQPILFLPTARDCSTNQEIVDYTNVTCQLENPLKIEDSLSFDLDITKMDDTSPDIKIEVRAESAADVEVDPIDNSYTLELKLEKKASLSVTGWSRPEQFTYERFNENTMKTNGSVEMKHGFSIEKKDATPLHDVEIEVLIPTNVTGEDGKQIAFLNKLTPELTFHAKLRSCDIENNSTGRMKKQQSGYEGSSSFTSLNCSSPRIKCALIKCNIGPWKRAYDVASLIVSFNLNFTTLSHIISVKEGFSLFSSIDVKITAHENSRQLKGQRRSNTTVQTVCFPGSLPAESLAWWIYLLAVLFGLLLLVLIAYVLYKVGFFRRKEKEELKAQQATLMTNEEQAS